MPCVSEKCTSVFPFCSWDFNDLHTFLKHRKLTLHRLVPKLVFLLQKWNFKICSTFFLLGTNLNVRESGATSIRGLHRSRGLRRSGSFIDQGLRRLGLRRSEGYADQKAMSIKGLRRSGCYIDHRATSMRGLRLSGSYID